MTEPVAKIEVKTEQENAHGWAYEVEIARAGGSLSCHSVSLSWVDHEFWCGGSVPPSRLIEALMAFLLQHEGEHPIPARFDAATIRRWYPDIDEQLSL
jgi:hypothetical protein